MEIGRTGVRTPEHTKARALSAGLSIPYQRNDQMIAHEILSQMTDVPEEEIASMQRRYPRIPRRTIQSVLRYVRFGIPPGHFVTAVLSNDLTEAVSRADDANAAALVDICSLVYNWIPNGCWGNPERVNRWIARHGLGIEASS